MFYLSKVKCKNSVELKPSLPNSHNKYLPKNELKKNKIKKNSTNSLVINKKYTALYPAMFQVASLEDIFQQIYFPWVRSIGISIISQNVNLIKYQGISVFIVS